MVDRLISRGVRGIALAIAMAGFSSVVMAAPPSLYASVQSALDGHVVPAFQRFGTATAMLASDTKTLCAVPSARQRDAVVIAFRETVTAWAGVAFLRFGPLARIGRPERISFWPDPRGVRERQLRPILAKRDAALLIHGAIAKQSAAIQGLPAFESLLTDRASKIDGLDQDSRYRCALAAAIADNVAGLARDIASEWTLPGGWRDKMLRPGSDNDTYREPAEAAAEIMKSILTGLQIVAEQQVRPRVQGLAQLGKSVAGPFARSGLSTIYFSSSVASLTDLFRDANFIEFLPVEDTKTKPAIDAALSVLAASDGAGGGSETIFGKTPPALPEVLEQLGQLRRMTAETVAKAAGITIGFNELDGD